MHCCFTKRAASVQQTLICFCSCEKPAVAERHFVHSWRRSRACRTRTAWLQQHTAIIICNLNSQLRCACLLAWPRRSRVWWFFVRNYSVQKCTNGRNVFLHPEIRKEELKHTHARPPRRQSPSTTLSRTGTCNRATLSMQQHSPRSWSRDATHGAAPAAGVHYRDRVCGHTKHGTKQGTKQGTNQGTNQVMEQGTEQGTKQETQRRHNTIQQLLRATNYLPKQQPRQQAPQTAKKN